jgi:pyruvate,water dikinase
MTQLILEPAAIDAPSLELLGGKARSLYELGRLEGARVPEWFAVSAEVFRDAVDRAGVGARISEALAALAEAGPTGNAVGVCVDALEPLLSKLAPTKIQIDAITAAYDKLGAEFVAVRSSALDEDGAERSFAGCLDTSLFVRGSEDVLHAVVNCWRSAFSERSLAYRAARGALDGEIRVAVVVQRMVTGSVSGVLFSADPSTGDRNRAIVTATWGLGEGVVSGKLACDTFVVRRDGTSVIDRDIAEKSHAIRHDVGAGEGTIEVEVADDARNEPTLGDGELSRLATLGWEIEDAYGRPVDVEWTWAEDGPWILQARPITTGAAPARATAPADGMPRLWDNSNIIESYNGVTTPLTYSFARRAYATVYRQAFELLGTPESDLNKNAKTFEQMIGLLRGRIYYNLESWYTVVKFLPGYKFNAEFMEQMMGVSETAKFSKDEPTKLSAARRYLIELPLLVKSLAVMGTRFARAGKLISEFYANFDEAYADFMEMDVESMSFDDLITAYLDAERRILQRWQAPIVNDILAMIFFGALRKAIATWNLGDGALHNDLLCGEGGMESTEPTRDLLRIMEDLREDPIACALLRNNTAREVRDAVDSDNQFAWLRVRVGFHVHRFGDRCIDELKLEEPTLRDDATFVYQALKGYLAAPTVTVDELETREKGIRAEAERIAKSGLKWRPDRKRMFEFLVAGARRHVKGRENLRFARTRAFGLVRRLVLGMGARLVEAGKLDDANDVFYIEIPELIAFARGTGTTTDLRGLAAVRKREYDGYRGAGDLPERFWTRGAVYLDPELTSVVNATTDVANAAVGEVLEGTGASPGVVRAKARLIRDPRGAELAGGVLVANRTDPGWVPLFPSAKAIVVERGSVLSHSAIVAREFGIPCVVGVRDALSRLEEGAMIEVDGNTGRITVL